MSYVIQRCAEKVFTEGYDMFAIQYYGECFAGKYADKKYDKYGTSQKGCINGVGKKWANYVYRINGRLIGTLLPRWGEGLPYKSDGGDGRKF